MAKDKLTEATKEAMGYTEERRTCQFCIHRKPMDTGLDRDYRDACYYSNLCHFEVPDHGSCKNFQSKNNNPH